MAAGVCPTVGPADADAELLSDLLSDPVCYRRLVAAAHVSLSVCTTAATPRRARAATRSTTPTHRPQHGPGPQGRGQPESGQTRLLGEEQEKLLSRWTGRRTSRSSSTIHGWSRPDRDPAGLHAAEPPGRSTRRPVRWPRHVYYLYPDRAAFGPPRRAGPAEDRHQQEHLPQRIGDDAELDRQTCRPTPGASGPSPRGDGGWRGSHLMRCSPGRSHRTLAVHPARWTNGARSAPQPRWTLVRRSGWTPRLNGAPHP